MARSGETRASAMQNLLIALEDIALNVKDKDRKEVQEAESQKPPKKIDAAEALLNCIRKVCKRQASMKLSQKLQNFILDFCEYKPKMRLQAHIKSNDDIEADAKKWLRYWQAFKSDRTLKVETTVKSPLVAGKRNVHPFQEQQHLTRGWSRADVSRDRSVLNAFHVKPSTPEGSENSGDSEVASNARNPVEVARHTDFRVKKIFNRSQMSLDALDAPQGDLSARSRRSREQSMSFELEHTPSSRRSRSNAETEQPKRSKTRSQIQLSELEPEERAQSIFSSVAVACEKQAGPCTWKAKVEKKVNKRQLTSVPDQLYRPRRPSLSDEGQIDDDPTGIKAQVRKSASESLQAVYDSMSDRIKRHLAEITVTEEMEREAVQDAEKSVYESGVNDPNEKILKDLKQFFREKFSGVAELVHYFDVNDNGHISYVEFKDGLRSLGLTWSNEKVKKVLDSMSGDQGAGYLLAEELEWVFQDSKEINFNELGRAKMAAIKLHTGYRKWKAKRMKREQKEELGLPRPEKGASFGITGRETEELACSPEYAYFNSCNQLGCVPLTLRWVWEGEKHSTSNVELAHSELLDDDLKAVMAPMLNCVHKEKLRKMDLSKNAFSDKGLCGLLDMMKDESRMYESLAHLDLSHNRLGLDAINHLSSMVGTKISGLRKFFLTGVVVPELCWGPLCQGLAQTELQELGLGDTSLGKVSQESAIHVAELVKSIGGHLAVLDLSCNCMQHRGFTALGAALAEAPGLETLDLSGSSGGFQRKASVELSPLATGGDNWYSPMPIICEALSFCTLKRLYMASCQLDFEADFVLEASLKGHQTMAYLDLRDNPHGMEGLRCLCRLLVAPDCKIEACLMDNFRSCYVPPTAAIPSPTDPTGHYDLELSIPQHRSVLRILKKHSLNQSGENNPWKDMKLNGKPTKDLPVVQRGDSWDITTTGLLSFTYTPVMDSSAASATEACKNAHKAKRLPVSLMRFVQLALLFRSLQSLEQIQIFATAVSKDLSLKLAHLKFFINNVPGYLKMGTRIVPYICRILFPALEDLDKFGIIDLCSSEMSESDASMSQTVTAGLVFFNADSPTDHYELTLSNPAERTIAEKLCAINYWHKKQAMLLGLPDVSKHGNYENIRNAVYMKMDFIWTTEFTLPWEGELSFDYAQPIHLPRKEKPQDEETVTRLVDAIESSEECRLIAKLRAIRSIAHSLKLTPQMVVRLIKLCRSKGQFQSSRMHGSLMARMSMLTAPDAPDTGSADPAAAKRKSKGPAFQPRCSYDSPVDLDADINGRVEIFIALFNRCTDVPRLITKQVLYNRELMDDSDMKEIKRRLGRLPTFDALHVCQENTNLGSGFPDGNRFEMYLPLWEDHVIAKFLVTLAAIEPDDYGNIRYSRWSELTYQSTAGSEDYIIPASWLPDPPRIGTLKLTYVSEKLEYIIEKQRYALGEKLLGWQNGQPFKHEDTKPSRLSNIYTRV